MKYIDFKDKKISLLSFGLMRLPVVANSKDIDYELGAKMIDYAIQNGVNYFDTAWFYHEYKSENFVGSVLSKYPRNSYYLADKIPMWEVNSLDDAKKLFHAQLDKCKTTYFDFYLVHALNDKSFTKYLDLKVHTYLLELKKLGYIKHLGFSFHDKPPILQKIIDFYDWEFCQLQINYYDWYEYLSKEQYQIARKAKLPIIIMEPVRGGMLANLNDEQVNIFRSINPSLSSAAWGLKYCFNLDGVLTVLSGMSNFEHVTDNINTINNFNFLSSSELNAIDKVTDLLRRSDYIACTNCRYCLPCTEDIDIPKAFDFYNKYRKTLQQKQFMIDIDTLTPLNNCSACGMCEPKCPQKLEIIKLLKKVNNTLSLFK